MNIIYKWVPYDYWQTKEYENWLKEQTPKGLKVQRAGTYWVRFIKAEPEQVEYRMSLSKTKLDKDSMTHLNWIKVDKCRCFILYKSTIANPNDELYQDKDEYMSDLIAHKEGCQKQLFGFTLAWLFAFIMIALMNFLGPVKYATLKLVTKGFGGIGFILLVQTVGFYREFRAYRGIKRLEKTIETGTYFEEEKRGKSTVKKLYYMVLLTMVYIVGFIQIKTIWTETEGYRLPMGDTDLPIVSLTTLEKNPTLTRDPADEEYTWTNVYEKDGNFFTKRIYEASESGVAKDAEGKNFYCAIKSEFYELNFGPIVRPVVEDLINKYNYIGRPYKEVEVPSLDKVYTWEEGYYIKLIATKGKRVMYVDYKGKAQLEELIREVERKITY